MMTQTIDQTESSVPPKEWRLPGDQSAICILETELGPLISESRSSVYDVMEAYDEGYSPAEICDIYNLSSHQVEVALAYIAAHRAQLEPELKEILIKKAERERYYRALAAERERQRPLPMTPQRAALQKLIEESRRRWPDPDENTSDEEHL